MIVFKEISGVNYIDLQCKTNVWKKKLHLKIMEHVDHMNTSLFYLWKVKLLASTRIFATPTSLLFFFLILLLLDQTQPWVKCYSLGFILTPHPPPKKKLNPTHAKCVG